MIKFRTVRCYLTENNVHHWILQVNFRKHIRIFFPPNDKLRFLNLILDQKIYWQWKKIHFSNKFCFGILERYKNPKLQRLYRNLDRYVLNETENICTYRLIIFRQSFIQHFIETFWQLFLHKQYILSCRISVQILRYWSNKKWLSENN